MILSLRLSAAERAALEVAAARVNETLSSFVRSSALDVAEALKDGDTP